MDYREILQEIYNRIFIRDPMRIEKAKLLLEFEETYRKRQELMGKLYRDADKLQDFARSIRKLWTGGFEKGIMDGELRRITLRNSTPC